LAHFVPREGLRIRGAISDYDFASDIAVFAGGLFCRKTKRQPFFRPEMYWYFVC